LLSSWTEKRPREERARIAIVEVDMPRLGSKCVVLWLLLASAGCSLNPDAGEGLCPFGCTPFGGTPDCSRDRSVMTLAHEIDHLEHHIDRFGTIVAKTPAIWGEARLTKHRREFEQQMSTQLDKFTLLLNGMISRSDQAYLMQAMSLSAAISGPAATEHIPGATPNAASTVSVISPPQINASTGAPSLTPGISSTQQPTTPTPGTPSQTIFTVPSTSTNVYQSPPFANAPFSVFSQGVGGFASSNLSLEPTIQLDQRARYLNHLHEIRRINEGDDTADAPGYELTLVRIPVSILPGKCTRVGHGAEITMSIESQYGEELLLRTYRNLVINDLVDLLGIPVMHLAKATSALDFGENTSTMPLPISPAPTSPAPTSPAPLPQLPQPRLMPTAGQGVELLQAPGSVSNAAPGTVQPRANLSPAKQKYLKSIGVADNAPTTINNLQNKLQAKVKRDLPQSVSTFSQRRARAPVPPSQVFPVFGFDELKLVAKGLAPQDEDENFDIQMILDVHKFLSSELEAAYDLMRHPALASWWSGDTPQKLAAAIDLNDTCSVARMRCAFIQEVRAFCMSQNPHELKSQVLPPLAWAILVESALLNERLNDDIKEVGSIRHAPQLAGAPRLPFYGPNPPPEARALFNEYVKVRWPIHVFALDPVTQDENLGDAFARRRETQLALALAFASGNMSASSFTRYSRRLEADMTTIALHRTAAGFSHGPNHFGWRFYPRFQTPDIPGNLTVIARDLIIGGPSKDADLNDARIEPGMRECIALVVMPSLVPAIKVETRSNWFKLTNPRCTAISMKQTMRLSEAIKRMEESAAVLCDAHKFRDGEVGRLLNRVEQLSNELPLQTLHQQVPQENTLGGFAMFNSGITDLAPQLTGYYCEPGFVPGQSTTVFLVGDHFSVHETSVIAGNRYCIPGDQVMMLSRRVLQVTIPPDAIPWDDKQTEIDVHVATPYGVSGHLQIPVKGETAHSAYTFATPRVFSQTFTTTIDTSTPPKITAYGVTNVLPTSRDFRVSGPTTQTFPAGGDAGVRLTLSYKGQVMAVSLDPAKARMQFDAVHNQFYLDDTNFTNIETDLKTKLNSSFKNTFDQNRPDSVRVELVCELYFSSPPPGGAGTNVTTIQRVVNPMTIQFNYTKTP
jgi:hypothetical protein